MARPEKGGPHLLSPARSECVDLAALYTSDLALLPEALRKELGGA